MTKMTLRGCVIAGLTIVPVAVASWPGELGRVRQQPIVGLNTLEFAYVHFANDLAAAGPRHGYYQGPDTIPTAVSVCEKISPHATELIASWGGFEGWSFSYVQTDCYYQVARSGKAPEVCDRMRDLDAPPPRLHLSRARERRMTQVQCRAEATRHGGGGGEFGSDVILGLLGYSREERLAAAAGRPLEEYDAYDFKRYLLDGHGDGGEDYAVMTDLMRRVARLPDFSRGDEAARRQIDTLLPHWSSPDNMSPLATSLSCYIQRLDVGEAMSARCD